MIPFSIFSFLVTWGSNWFSWVLSSPSRPWRMPPLLLGFVWFHYTRWLSMRKMEDTRSWMRSPWDSSMEKLLSRFYSVHLLSSCWWIPCSCHLKRIWRRNRHWNWRSTWRTKRVLRAMDSHAGNQRKLSVCSESFWLLCFSKYKRTRFGCEWWLLEIHFHLLESWVSDHHCHFPFLGCQQMADSSPSVVWRVTFPVQRTDFRKLKSGIRKTKWDDFWLWGSFCLLMRNVRFIPVFLSNQNQLNHPMRLPLNYRKWIWKAEISLWFSIDSANSSMEFLLSWSSPLFLKSLVTLILKGMFRKELRV